MGTVGVEYYDAVCTLCGWQHRVMYGAGMGWIHAHALAVEQHRKATAGCCYAPPDAIQEQPSQLDT